MDDKPPVITSPLGLIRLARPLFHLERKLAGDGPVKIVAIGSSSTAGERSIPPYPGRLESAMNVENSGRVTVINKGVSGQEAPLELARLDRDVISEAPAMTIWQVGANAAFKQYDLDDIAMAIDRGLARLNAQPMDVLLMDLQYVPALLKSDTLIGATERMVSLIAEAADRAGVNVFRRFALMRHWQDHDRVPVSEMVNKDDPMQLHQSEWSTAGVAQALKSAIHDAVERAKRTVASDTQWRN
jgi:hypothetical protein